MNSTQETIRKELVKLSASLTALGQLETNKSKGEFLIQEFIKSKKLAWYYKVIVGDTPIPHAWVDAAEHLHGHEMACTSLLFDTSIPCGAPHNVIRRALVIAETGRVAEEQRQAKTIIEIDLTGGIDKTITADLRCNGSKVGNMVLYAGPNLKATMDYLRAAGVLVNKTV